MPQLIAMIIVVVGAMIYMFQTFGGTGDKIEGVAQKGSIITEINNIKDGLKIAAKSGHIMVTPSGDAVKSLEGLAELSYFAAQINEQLTTTNALNTVAKDTYNTYNAISFGGTVIDTTNKSAMQISLVADKQGVIPGIFVDLSKGSLADNAAFLEAQIAKDLEAIATIDRNATIIASGAAPTATTGVEAITPIQTGGATITAGQDGMFIIYFKDFGQAELVK